MFSHRAIISRLSFLERESGVLLYYSNKYIYIIQKKENGTQTIRVAENTGRRCERDESLSVM